MVFSPLHINMLGINLALYPVHKSIRDYIILFSVFGSTTKGQEQPHISFFLPMIIGAIRNRGEQCHSFGFTQSRTYICGEQSRQVFLLGTDCLSQAISDSKSFTVSEHFHIRIIRLRVSAADWRFSLSHKTRTQAFTLCLTTIVFIRLDFSCHY